MELPNSLIDDKFLNPEFSINDFIEEMGLMFTDPDKIYSEIVRLAEIEKNLTEACGTAKLQMNFDFSSISEVTSQIRSALELTALTRNQLHKIDSTYLNQLNQFEQLNRTKNRLKQILEILKLIRHSMNEQIPSDDSITEVIDSINQCRLVFDQFYSSPLKKQFTTQLEKFTNYTENKIDKTLRSLTLNFSPQVYSSLISSYSTLFPHTHPDKQHMFGERLTNTFRISVNDSIKDCISLNKISFDEFENNFCAAFEKTWAIMKCYLQIHTWNCQHFDKSTERPNMSFEAISSTAIQTIDILLQSFDDFKSLDDFTRIVSFLSKFIKMCQTFASFDGPNKHGINDFVQIIYSWASTTFTTLNRQKIEEMTLQLENEHWHDCPVSCIRPSKRIVIIHELSVLIRFIFELPPESTNTEENFEFQDPLEISFLSSKKSKSTLEKFSFQDQLTGTQEFYHISSTGVNFLRMFGKYIDLMDIFPSTSFLVITSVYDMLFVFIKIVFCTFVDRNLVFEESLNERMTEFTRRFDVEGELADNAEFDTNITKFKCFMVAMETINCIASHLYMSHTLLLTSHVKESTTIINIYDITSNMIAELTEFVLRSFGRTLMFDSKIIVSSITSRKWGTSLINGSEMTQNMNFIVNDVKAVKEGIDAIVEELAIEESKFSDMWDEFSYFLCETLLEGYGKIKKCSIEGRGQMLFECENLFVNLAEVTENNLVDKYKDKVLNYIRAFFMEKTDLEEFIKNNKEYSNKQMSALIISMDHLGFLVKQKLQILVNAENHQL